MGVVFKCTHIFETNKKQHIKTQKEAFEYDNVGLVNIVTPTIKNTYIYKHELTLNITQTKVKGI